LTGRQELVDFMVDYVVKNEIEAMIDIIAKEDIPMVEEAPTRFIIVASPILQPIGEDYSNWMNALDTDNAEQVWIYEAGKLIVQADKQRAISDYRDLMNSAPMMPGIFTYGYNEFGIISLSDDGQQAEVYLVAICGSVCAHGIILMMERSPDSPWEVRDIKGLWGS